MKTDIERFIEMYASFGVEVKESQIRESYGDKESYRLIEFGYRSELNENKLLNIGYSNCSMEVRFDLDGKFVGQGYWEE